MTDTGNQDFIAGWFLASSESEFPSDASQEMIDGFNRVTKDKNKETENDRKEK